MGRRRRKNPIEGLDYGPEGFSPRRGIQYFFIGLVAFSIMVGISTLADGPISIVRAAAFVLIASAVVGVIGVFTENVPF